jgi:hypothetical protein
MVRGDDPLAEFFRVGLGHLDLRDGGPITRLPSTGNPSPRLDQLGSGRLYMLGRRASHRIHTRVPAVPYAATARALWSRAG